MAVTEIAVPSRVWVKALSSRIRMICATRSGSPRAVNRYSGCFGIALDLLAQVADVHVYRARIAVLGVPPDPLEQHLARVDASGIGRERGEELELDVGEANTTVPDHHTSAVEIDLERPGDDRLAGGRAGPEHVRAAQRGLHPAAKLAHRERLGDVVVGAHLELEHLVDLVVLRGQHDDRHLASAPQPPADLDPVELREHDVEHHKVEALRGEAVERLAPVTRRNHLVALLPQGVGEQLLDRMLVVHEQDASRSLGHGTRVFGPS
jgi:hypothetical protein